MLLQQQLKKTDPHQSEHKEEASKLDQQTAEAQAQKLEIH